MYKMVVSDFYGTLINSEEAISLSTMIELDRIRKEGVLFCITTSKSARVVIDYNRDFPFIDYVVAFNGSYIYDLVKDKVLYDKSMMVNVVKKLYKLFNGKDMCFYTLDCCNYIGKYRDNDFSEMIIDTDSFIEKNRKGIYKVKVFFNTSKEAKEAIKILKEEKRVVCYLKEVNDVFVVEIYSSVDSKRSGVEVVLKKNKLKFSDVLAISSSVSSYDLLQKVGYGCVVANGCDKLKKIAMEETSSNEEKGVELIIKKYF